MDVQPENINSMVLKIITITIVFSSLILCYIIELFEMLKVWRETFFSSSDQRCDLLIRESEMSRQ